MLIANTPKEVNKCWLLTLKSALKLEELGMKRRGKSAYKVFKDAYCFTGTRKEAIAFIDEILK